MSKLKRKQYLAALAALQIELLAMSRWLQHTGKRVAVMVIEGRDTAGKGGVVNAISEFLNPRHCHVLALLPDTQVAEAGFELPALEAKPRKERYGVLKPIKSCRGD